MPLLTHAAQKVAEAILGGAVGAALGLGFGYARWRWFSWL
jgi:hypothetical protein